MFSSYKDPLFTIDFVRTTPVTAELEKLKCDPKKYPKVWFTPQRKTLAEHDHQTAQCPIRDVERTEWRLQKFREIGYSAIGVMFTVLAIMVAALAVVAVVPPALNLRVHPSAIGLWIAFAGQLYRFYLSLLMYCNMVVYKRFSDSAHVMQNRYVGDIGDFGKYGLLRSLCGVSEILNSHHSPRLGVVWYLYPDESHDSDGKYTGYLACNSKNHARVSRFVIRISTMCFKGWWTRTTVTSPQ